MRLFLGLILFINFCFASIIKIIVVGDIMTHKPQIDYAKINAGYDFSPQFSNIKDFLKSADLVVGNFESASNPNLAYKGYPLFNTPPEIFKALKDAGFHALSTANNHALDAGIDGIFSTNEAIKNAGLFSFGTGKQKELILDVKGVKIALLSYSYGYNGLENSISLNEKKFINFLDEDQIQKDIEKMSKLGADFIMVFPHWGVEYQSFSSKSQQILAKKMINFGVNAVIGNHPHVTQEISWDVQNGFIAYSCGNFISNQRLETIKKIQSEQSVAYEIVVSKDENFTQIVDVYASPLWVNPVFENGKKTIKVFLANDIMEENYDKNTTKFLISNPEIRAKKAYDDFLKKISDLNASF
ncbi:CapA family protein [Campylobacter corcagiensis]|uniref:CapA family protein n=1 Tax=Campylobacter corcagiensis TaxID=1448857 RepID=A0A7M1LEU5_9BACT|nr:CapA family protein [Campylobacter corcagiensis]QKF64982.1 CapA family protein [Campylobacter corcagiensis]QOQ86861.1 CapA family protein [Campylobacter corcagiensis]